LERACFIIVIITLFSFGDIDNFRNVEKAKIFQGQTLLYFLNNLLWRKNQAKNGMLKCRLENKISW